MTMRSNKAIVNAAGQTITTAGLACWRRTEPGAGEEVHSADF